MTWAPAGGLTPDGPAPKRGPRLMLRDGQGRRLWVGTPAELRDDNPEDPAVRDAIPRALDGLAVPLGGGAAPERWLMLAPAWGAAHWKE